VRRSGRVRGALGCCTETARGLRSPGLWVAMWVCRGLWDTVGYHEILWYVAWCQCYTYAMANSSPLSLAIHDDSSSTPPAQQPAPSPHFSLQHTPGPSVEKTHTARPSAVHIALYLLPGWTSHPSNPIHLPAAPDVHRNESNSREINGAPLCFLRGAMLRRYLTENGGAPCHAMPMPCPGGWLQVWSPGQVRAGKGS
jgi:hypothetical protein